MLASAWPRGTGTFRGAQPFRVMVSFGQDTVRLRATLFDEPARRSIAQAQFCGRASAFCTIRAAFVAALLAADRSNVGALRTESLERARGRCAAFGGVKTHPCAAKTGPGRQSPAAIACAGRFANSSCRTGVSPAQRQGDRIPGDSSGSNSGVLPLCCADPQSRPARFLGRSGRFLLLLAT